MVCVSYLIVNTLHKGDNKDDNTTTTTNNNIIIIIILILAPYNKTYILIIPVNESTDYIVLHKFASV